MSTDSVGAGFVQQREAAPDHRVADLAHRHRPRDGARPAQPQQLVLAGELVDRGAAVHARNVVPQRQRLGVAQHRADPARARPAARPAASGSTARIPRRRWTRRPPGPWAADATAPRPPPGVPGTRRTPPARCRPSRRRAVRGRRRSATTPRRRWPVDPKPIAVVADLVPLHRLPSPHAGDPAARR